MRKQINCIWMLLAVTLLLSGCMKSVDQLYRLPKRSDEFTELQAAIDEAMVGLSYCAPRSGENQQAVQMADLDGDGADEYLVYAKSESQSVLNVLIFRQSKGGYDLAREIQCKGTSFDMVEYAQLDDRAGDELILGSQLSEKIQRNAEIYTFTDELDMDLLLSTRYAEYLVLDLDQDQIQEVFFLKPAEKETDPGNVELYRMESGTLIRSNAVALSAPVENLKRVITGNIHGGIPAVFAATTANDTALITDVYILKDDRLCNVTLSGDFGTSIRTLRSQYIYAEDIDSDGVIELPYLLPMMPMDNMVTGGKQELIRWYAVKANGDEVIKNYTFHNFTDSWYLQLDENWAQRLTVVADTGAYEFYIWDEEFVSAKKVLTIYEKAGTARNVDEPDPMELLLHESNSLRLTARLEDVSESFGITETTLKENFHMIRQNWKTGET